MVAVLRLVAMSGSTAASRISSARRSLGSASLEPRLRLLEEQPQLRRALGPEQHSQAVEAGGGVGVVGSQRLLADRQRPTEQRLRLPVPTLVPEQLSQVVEAGGRVEVSGHVGDGGPVGVVGVHRRLADLQCPTEQLLRLPVVTALGPEHPCQIVEGENHVGVVGSQRRLADLQCPTEQRLRLPVPALGLEQQRQVVEADGRVGVVRAQLRLADLQCPTEQRLRLPVVTALEPEQHSQVVEASGRVGVVGAQRLPDRQRPAVQPLRLGVSGTKVEVISGLIQQLRRRRDEQGLF